MKKIIATVLAMVMALALCTTAFAAVPTWTTANGGVNSVSIYKMSNQKVANNVMTYHAAVAPVYNTDGTIKTFGAVEYYTFATNVEIDGTTYAAGTAFSMSATYSKDASFAVKAADDSAVNTQTSPEALYFMTHIDAIHYIVAGEKFTTWGAQCGQYKDPGDTATVTYVKYTYAGTETIQALSATTSEGNPAANVLVDGVVKTMSDRTVTKTPHNWVASAWDKDSKATAYKCSVCGTVGTVVASPYDPATRGHQVEKLGEGVYVYFDYTPGTTNNGSASSPKTFDAGIAMYVGMALTSVAGSAVVIGKKKEF